MAVMADHAGADNSIPVSEWDYCTIGELVSALRRRTISASELIEHTIARIEALDTRLNAIVVRDFERAREGGPCSRRRAGPRRTATAARRAGHCQRGVQRRRAANNLGLSAVQGLRP
jgi:hypothetical protein